MHLILLSVVFLAFCGLTSCNNQDSFDKHNPKWITYKLYDYWVFDAPKGAKIIYQQGIDSTPGSIALAANDSVILEFDSGFESSVIDTICDLGSETVYAKRRVARGDYKYLNKPDTLHQARIDTVNGLAAITIVPVKTGVGITKVTISNCSSNRWLAISGKNIPYNKQELILKIYASIRQVKSK
ncbi:hypothetical protein [Hymenobacter lapidarius]|uniref:hypothetical protein n=1 Tax=Hymenobacter lapidarius TaxID=1908237 RepID=UPI000F76AAE4|nr:hypothetical protein [Hymenobacter lapidarius]